MRRMLLQKKQIEFLTIFNFIFIVDLYLGARKIAFGAWWWLMF